MNRQFFVAGRLLSGFVDWGPLVATFSRLVLLFRFEPLLIHSAGLKRDQHFWGLGKWLGLWQGLTNTTTSSTRTSSTRTTSTATRTATRLYQKWSRMIDPNGVMILVMCFTSRWVLLPLSPSPRPRSPRLHWRTPPGPPPHEPSPPRPFIPPRHFPASAPWLKTGAATLHVVCFMCRGDQCLFVTSWVGLEVIWIWVQWSIPTRRALLWTTPPFQSALHKPQCSGQTHRRLGWSGEAELNVEHGESLKR